jgi:uncharacterized surface protein with fasciclin (FAS1) repeats
MVNKKLFSVILATLVTLSIVGGASVAFAQTSVVTTQKTTIVTTAESVPQTFSDLVKALNATNLTSTLNDTSKNFTVFAPNDAAFGALGNVTLTDLLTNNTTKLSTILLSHVVSGRVNLTTSGNATTLAGNTISWNTTSKTVQLVGGTNNATFVGTPVNTTNGQVQQINAVLQMPAVTSTAAATTSTSSGFLGLPGFQLFPAVAGLLVVAYLMLRRRR